MKKNIFLIIISLLLLTGCSSEYTLEFNNKSIKENITVDIMDSDIPKKTSNMLSELDDRITPFMEEDQYPFAGDETKKYNKKVTDISSGKRIEFKYKYSHNEFRNSTTYNTCFENKEFTEERNSYIINFGGKFFCRHTDEVVINIKTNNYVISNNADKVEGNTYTWIINDDNIDKTDIQIVISKKSKSTKYILYAILAAIVLVLVVSGFSIYSKIQNRDSVNEI